MNITPKISVIIPIYNAEKYLAKCIESVQQQTYRNLEIILVNDGATDSSINICKKYEKYDERIILIDKANEGVASARNCGLEIATGDFIGFVDSDDYIDPIMYERLLEAAMNFDADIAECGYSVVNNHYRIRDNHPLENSVLVGNYQCSRDYITKKNTTNFNFNKLYRRSIFKELRYPDLSYSEDYIVNVRAFYKCNRKVTISGCYYYYLKNETSACNRPFTEAKLDALKAGKEIVEFHESRFSDLCPFAAIYILEKIIQIYRQLNLKERDHEKLKTMLLREYRQYYPMIKGTGFYRMLFNKRGFALWVFGISPNTYLTITLFHKKLKKQNFCKNLNNGN